MNIGPFHLPARVAVWVVAFAFACQGGRCLWDAIDVSWHSGAIDPISWLGSTLILVAWGLWIRRPSSYRWAIRWIWTGYLWHVARLLLLLWIFNDPTVLTGPPPHEGFFDPPVVPVASIGFQCAMGLLILFVLHRLLLRQEVRACFSSTFTSTTNDQPLPSAGV